MMRPLPAIEELVAHRPPALVLDEITSWTGDRLVCAATIRAASGGARDVRPITVLEHMAQTVAAYERLTAATRTGSAGTPRRGYLVAVGDLRLEPVELRGGDRLTVEATRVYTDEDLGRFAAVVRRGPSLVAEARLTVYRATP